MKIVTQRKSIKTTKRPKSLLATAQVFPPSVTLMLTVSVLQLAIAMNHGSGSFGVALRLFNYVYISVELSAGVILERSVEKAVLMVAR